MSKSQKSSHVVALRLSTEERDNIEALAASRGQSLSAYIRGELGHAAARPRPVLAAAGALLAITAALTEAVETIDLAADRRAFIRRQAHLVLSILKLHDCGGDR